MDNSELLKLWEDFKEKYNFEEKIQIWQNKSEQFKKFWNDKILPDGGDLVDEEIDLIIKILDSNGKGNTKSDESVARAMIAQGAWRRMFREIHVSSDLKQTLNNIFLSVDENKTQSEIDNLYKLNLGRKNFLTGENGNAINDMMFAYSPSRYVSIVSFNHRMKVIGYFGLQNSPLDSDSPGKRMVQSNKAIIDGFRSLGMESFPRAISDFLYTSLKNLWNKKQNDEEEVEESEEEISEEKIEQLNEEYYQKLIHRNFKKIFPDLSYVDDDYQNIHEGHYITTEGKIMDFLCKDKAGDFVVVELKVGGSDKSLGQICRYMGWVKENLCENNEKVKGLIVSEQRDIQLGYAIKVVPDVSFKRMWLDVKVVSWNDTESNK